MTMQTFKVPSSEVPGYSAIYRNSLSKDGTHGGEFAHITTAHELFQHQLAIAPKAEFLGTRQFNPADGSFGAYEWLTTTDAAEYVENFGSGLDHVFAKYAPDAKGYGGQQALGMYANNRYEWTVAEFGAFRSRRFTVGICDSVDVESAEYVINNAEISVVVCSIDKIPRMFDRMSITPSLRVIICMDRLDCSRPTPVMQAFCPESVAALRKRAVELGITLLDMDEVLEMGRATPTTAQPPLPTDICTMCYTSGTTGVNKGVLLTHQGLIHGSRSCHLSLRFSDTTHLSLIPLAHCMDRYATYTFMYGGVRVGFANGDRALIVNDIQELRPTVLVGFPLLLIGIYESMSKATIGAKGVTGVLSRMAYRSKKKRLAATGNLSHGLWDRVLFSKVAAKLGGRIKTIISGAMNLNPEVINFFRAALSCNVVQGYGQTETGAAGTIQRLGDFTSGHIGVPTPGNDIRLRSKPDFGYLVTDSPCPRGELMIRSKSVFAEYLGEPEKTSESMDGEWLATGDVVQINPTGTISFISRMKNHVKINTGYCVSSERLENIYSQHPLVHSLFVDGHQDYNQVVAIVVPDSAEFVPWARTIASLPTATLEELCDNEKVVKELTELLRIYSASVGLSIGEQLGAIYLEPMPFRERNSSMYTALLKLKRQAAAKYYEEQLQKLYTKVGGLFVISSP
ncbi:medium-chain fatty acid-CoA ligase faa2 [Coemansia sp. RSA 922]|nr:medium-chain fatty acid-CoA ligase faa2 [Coemansia sp. S17]KAJ2017261.1 medium-chain fatty acid-CoA ligase faa2 [Coemansia sp. S680]KAJ2049460.1 medium-chain fatty acid-CoA ligase faa2 [Coemansia sp. S16]KAJ2070127.1 medium-chain fatty acid-CoA ligase faa2 [Coemansia sp. S155-1]KAJ2097921.1 medium-chain fatty acid-CoA ligase faa2 [Coemansia sp. S100]KAJ2117587.1 medium-chain fatty acid-CoA ligase faa2 [Coemansia sp. RSA 922]